MLFRKIRELFYQKSDWHEGLLCAERIVKETNIRNLYDMIMKNEFFLDTVQFNQGVTDYYVHMRCKSEAEALTQHPREYVMENIRDVKEAMEKLNRKKGRTVLNNYAGTRLL